MRLVGIIATLLICAGPGPAGAVGLALLDEAGTSTEALSPLSVDISGQVFLRTRIRRKVGDEFESRYELSRARAKLTLRYLDFVRLTIRPEFAGEVTLGASPSQANEADPSDYFLDLAPVKTLRLRIGQAKVPYGLFEILGRWRLPSQARGLVSEIVSKRVGLGGRRLGTGARLRLSDLALRPQLEVGAYRTSRDSEKFDGAVRLGARPFKGALLTLAGYARGDGAANNAHAYAAALSFDYDKKGVFIAAEVMLVRARWLLLDGDVPGQNATLVATRGLFAYAIDLDDDFRLEPYVGVDLIDPNARTTDDLGGAIRGGVNVRYREVARVSLEAGHQQPLPNQTAFIATETTTIILFFGVSLG